MNRFSQFSQANLVTAIEPLQAAAEIVLQIKDHAILKGHRSESEQNEAFESGHSKLPWPHGKHNQWHSRAIDVQTYPRPKDEQKLREEQYYLLGIYVGVLHSMGHEVRTGADWDSDGEVSDNGWDDLFHIEVTE